MSFFNKLKSKISGHKQSKAPVEKEQQFTIQPHPATSNDPADLQQPSGPGGGLRADAVAGALHARDPYIPSPEVAANLPEPTGREELHARQAELNSST